ncbi:RdgB/HAM1 family non-canonical purine NTP pyrophosphatase [Actinoalloteichus caeruleus]|uniref:XTP/dITP diphosphohydrolase n=1 Tax=Actinoalloteichus caeruleus DSM 43889 TaxID=1120930 RepID=A0ABT1JLU2_ACTCY|nr:RdgB/HAM1 family non-canonical purine NTP pyrophosphatase [Actinoalloteichus caeruleus]MCP2333121.1 XTP/dITP diphosphohydrolase [Actinoalloteichus caeruleus DSM 43889]
MRPFTVAGFGRVSVSHDRFNLELPAGDIAAAEHPSARAPEHPSTRRIGMITAVSLITGNAGKAAEYTELLGVPVTAVRDELVEIQSLDVEEVVRHKAAQAYRTRRAPVLVDDTALTFDAWNGLPGPLIAWFLKAQGVEGLVRMAAGYSNRAATATTALGYADADGVRVFTGTLRGSVAHAPRGGNGFGYDSIFIPEGEDRTYAEMDTAEKHRISHRRHAVDALRRGLGLAAPTT